MEANENLVLCRMDDPLGFGLFARKDMSCGDFVSTYSGIICHNGSTKDFHPYSFALGDATCVSILGPHVDRTSLIDRMVDLTHNQLILDAQTRGNLARFIQHLPEPLGAWHERAVRSRAEEFARLVAAGDEKEFISKWVRYHAIFKESEELATVLKKAHITWKLCQLPNRDPIELMLPIFRPGARKEESGAPSTSSATVKAGQGEGHLKATMDGQNMAVDWTKKGQPYETKVAYENLRQKKVFWPSKDPLLVLVAAMDIRRGDILGFDYGHGYWTGRGSLPLLVQESGQIIPRSAYKYRSFGVKMVTSQGLFHAIYYSSEMYSHHLVSRNGGHLTEEQSCPAIKTPNTTTDRGVSISFYEMRKKLVQANLIGEEHAPLPLDDYPLARTLAQIVPQGVIVDLFRRNPSLSGTADYDALDLVCHAPSMDAFIKTFYIFRCVGLQKGLSFVWCDGWCRCIMLRSIQHGHKELDALLELSRDPGLRAQFLLRVDITFLHIAKRLHDEVELNMATVGDTQVGLLC